MRSTRATLIYSGALLLLGLGIGSASTLLIQAWTTPPPTPPRPQPEPAPKPLLATPLLLEGEPSMGRADAPLTIVEFSDFECSYCQRFHDQVLPQLKKDYVNTGLVRFIHKDLPLPFHPQAKPAAAAARCAGEQNRYWEIYGALFDQQQCMSCKGAEGIAREQQIDTSALKACMGRESTKALINANISEATLHNIRATPTFVIGPTRSDGRHTGDIVEGALPWPDFKTLVEAQLKALRSG